MDLRRSRAHPCPCVQPQCDGVAAHRGTGVRHTVCGEHRVNFPLAVDVVECDLASAKYQISKALHSPTMYNLRVNAVM